MSITPVPRIAVIVVAAGSGTRLAAGEPKAFVGIDGRSVLHHAVHGVFEAPQAQVIVVAPPGREGDALTDARDASGGRSELISVVTGGTSRQASVREGLTHVWPDVEIVLVHDAARALTPPDVFARVIAAVDEGSAAVLPVLPVIDTIKRVDRGQVIAAVDRAELAAAQTPQGFRRDVLEAAYQMAGQDYTDDAAVVAAAGHDVFVVDGDPLAFKITTPTDLERARALVARSRLAASDAAEPDATVPNGTEPDATEPDAEWVIPRVGVGTDVHAFGGEGSLWLAGLEWPGEPALSGHSDGDAVSHAIVDALLSAAGLGDIGTHFGTDHPEYAGAHAEVFLGRTLELLRKAGWRVGNVAVQLQANRPRFSGRRLEAEGALSAALGGASVSISATTTDGLGFTGRGEGVAVFATALVVAAKAAPRA